jgi:nucleotide-binding universal stress UspA family protein
MPIKTILVPLMGLPTDQHALDIAYRAGQRLNAHITALYAAPDPRNTVAYLGEGMTSAMIEDFIATAEKETGAKLRLARETYDQVRGTWNVPVREKAVQGVGFSTAFVVADGRPDDMMAERGRVNDLIVTGLPGTNDDATLAAVVHAAIIDTNRPVLVTPPKTHEEPFRRIAVAWNGSAPAAHAVARALPFLTAADKVTVLAVQDTEFGGPPAPQAVDYLAWHGVNASSIPVEPGSKPVGIALLEAAGNAGANMLVMGAYSQSRVRRLIFGGVTRDILESAGLPVMMAH